MPQQTRVVVAVGLETEERRGPKETEWEPRPQRPLLHSIIAGNGKLANVQKTVTVSEAGLKAEST